MSAALRIVLSAAPFAASIVVGWRWLNGCMAQGAPMIGFTVWGLLLGLSLITMASIPVVVGGASSLVLAEVLRLRPPAVVGIVADRWLSFLVPLAFFGAAWLTWWFMWRVSTPVPSRDAPYGASYFWITAWTGGAWSVLFGAGAWHFVTREVRLTPDAAAIP